MTPMRYIKIYRDAIIAAGVMVLMIIAAPILVSVVMSYVTASAATALIKSRPLVTFGMQGFFFIVGVVVVWFLVKAQAGVIAERDIAPEAVDTYRKMRDSGIDPAIAHRVVSTSMEMKPSERTKDWEQANQPNFSAELSQSLGVDRETRKMMRDFFLANVDERDSRRSFSTSTQISIENDSIKKSHMIDGVVEPALDRQPPPPIIAEQARPSTLPPPPPQIAAEPPTTYSPPPPIVAGPAKPPLNAAALEAFQEGKLSVPPRAQTIHDASDYEQDLGATQPSIYLPPPPIVEEQAKSPEEPEPPTSDAAAESMLDIKPEPKIGEETPAAEPDQQLLDVETEPPVEEQPALDFLSPSQEPDQQLLDAETESTPEPHVGEQVTEDDDKFVPPPPPPIIADGSSLFNIKLNK
jgi:hypothetical protein